MLSDNELGAKVKAIFHAPITWQSQSAAIQALKRKCGDAPEENVIGHPARNASLRAKQAAANDTKASTRTAPGHAPEPLAKRYVEDEPGPVDRGGKPIAAKKTSKKKATQKKA
jgi:hypothetical protein